MSRVFWSLFFALTVAGAALPFLTPASWPWWDSSWIFVFFVAVYSDLATSSGLPAARFSSGIVVISMAVLLGLTGLTGWPAGPLQFTSHAGLQLGGVIPLTLPLLAFAILTVSAQAAASAFPGANRTGLALATAGGFVASVVNGLAFFVSDRIWWLWNPPGGPHAAGHAGFGLLFLAVTAFALAFAYPADTRMQRSRWNTGFVAWLAINALFLTANLALALAWPNW
jgi:uncharacterized membrane protein